MTLLLNCQDLSKSFGSRKLFSDLSLSIFTGDRIGLIGPNGTGKSTLLKILAGVETPDSGEISMNRGLKVGYVPQTSLFPDQKPAEVLLEALQGDTHLSDSEREALVQTWLNKFDFRERDTPASLLSGGWKKRLAIARELISSPDLLLLDEPTNHLDLEGLLWLEKFLSRASVTYLLVSHDRYFLQNAASRIIEIDTSYPKGTFAINGSYTEFLKKKEEFLEGQLETQRSLATTARREVEWLRRSPKARMSKSKSRVEDAHELLDELSQVKQRNKKRRAEIEFTASERDTRKLLVAKNLSKNVGERTLFRNLDFTLSPGTRISLMGPNGSGKTTLLRLLTGEISPDQGTIKRAQDLKVVYFDQHRAGLPDEISLRQALSPNGDYVTYQGHPIHVNGWCKRFLFSPDILDMRLAQLSGGERARIAIAHLMLQPADLLLLDEPTNDLDIPTLEILEESLLEFPGAVVLITHDRYMMSRICNLFLALGDVERTDLYADYAQWEAQAKNTLSPPKPKEKKKEPTPPPKSKLTYAETREYEKIEGEIAGLEQQIAKLSHLLEDPSVAENPARLQETCTKLSASEARMEQLYLRFLELDQKR